MPRYEITYICSLSDQQQDGLAEAITKIHSEKFNTPRLFVNVSFQPATANAYIAGKRRKTNHILGQLRTGPSRTKQDYDEVGEKIIRVWEDIVGTQGAQKLGAVFIVGGLLSAHESGLLIPPTGEESEWIKQNFATFQQRAADGYEEFRDLVEELRTRDCFKQSVPEAA